jgi:hypothetical protein
VVVLIKELRSDAVGFLAGDWVEAKKYIQGQEYWVKCQVIETRPRYNRYKVDFGPGAQVGRSAKEVIFVNG